MSKSREKKITEQRGYQLNLSNYWSKLAHIMYGLIKFAKQSVLCLSTRILLPLFIQCELSNTHAGGRKGFEIAIVTFTLSVHFQMTKVPYGISILQKKAIQRTIPRHQSAPPFPTGHESFSADDAMKEIPSEWCIVANPD